MLPSTLCLLLLQVSYFEIYMDKIRDLLDGLCHSTTNTTPLGTPALVGNTSCVRKWLVMLCRSSAGHKRTGRSLHGDLHSHPFICWRAFGAVCGPRGSQPMKIKAEKQNRKSVLDLLLLKSTKDVLFLLTECPSVGIQYLTTHFKSHWGGIQREPNADFLGVGEGGCAASCWLHL